MRSKFPKSKVKEEWMDKDKFLHRLEEILPDESKVIYADVTVFTREFITLNYDTDSDEIG